MHSQDHCKHDRLKIMKILCPLLAKAPYLKQNVFLIDISMHRYSIFSKIYRLHLQIVEIYISFRTRNMYIVKTTSNHDHLKIMKILCPLLAKAPYLKRNLQWKQNGREKEVRETAYLQTIFINSISNSAQLTCVYTTPFGRSVWT